MRRISVAIEWCKKPSITFKWLQNPSSGGICYLSLIGLLEFNWTDQPADTHGSPLVVPAPDRIEAGAVKSDLGQRIEIRIHHRALSELRVGTSIRRREQTELLCDLVCFGSIS